MKIIKIKNTNKLLLFCNGTELDTGDCDLDWITNLCDLRQSGDIRASDANQALLLKLFQLGGIE